MVLKKEKLNEELENFTYYEGKKKKNIKVKKVSVFSSGLMFRKNSPPLLFELGKVRDIPITSIFCNPFIAYFLDDKKKVIKKIIVTRWKFRIPGRGKYLLEVPLENEY